MKNESGIRPIEYNVVVKIDEVEEKTAGGLYLADTSKARKETAETRGTLVATSPMAFTYEDWPDGEPFPQPGDRVFFAQHAGVKQVGLDDKIYRIIKDRDVIGYLSEGAA